MGKSGRSGDSQCGGSSRRPAKLKDPSVEVLKKDSLCRSILMAISNTVEDTWSIFRPYYLETATIFWNFILEILPYFGKAFDQLLAGMVNFCNYSIETIKVINDKIKPILKSIQCAMYDFYTWLCTVFDWFCHNIHSILNGFWDISCQAWASVSDLTMQVYSLILLPLFRWIKNGVYNGYTYCYQICVPLITQFYCKCADIIKWMCNNISSIIPIIYNKMAHLFYQLRLVLEHTFVAFYQSVILPTLTCMKNGIYNGYSWVCQNVIPQLSKLWDKIFIIFPKIYHFFNYLLKDELIPILTKISSNITFCVKYLKHLAYDKVVYLLQYLKYCFNYIGNIFVKNWNDIVLPTIKAVTAQLSQLLDFLWDKVFIISRKVYNWVDYLLKHGLMPILTNLNGKINFCVKYCIDKMVWVLEHLNQCLNYIVNMLVKNWNDVLLPVINIIIPKCKLIASKCLGYCYDGIIYFKENLVDALITNGIVWLNVIVENLGQLCQVCWQSLQSMIDTLDLANKFYQIMGQISRLAEWIIQLIVNGTFWSTIGNMLVNGFEFVLLTMENMYRFVLEYNICKLQMLPKYEMLEIGIYKAKMIENENNNNNLTHLMTNKRLKRESKDETKWQSILDGVDRLKERRKRFFKKLFFPKSSNVAPNPQICVAGKPKKESKLKRIFKKNKEKREKMIEKYKKWQRKFRDKVLFKPRDLLFSLWLRNNDSIKKCNCKIFIHLKNESKHCIGNYRLDTGSSYTIAITQSMIDQQFEKMIENNQDKEGEIIDNNMNNKQEKMEMVHVSAWFYVENVIKTREMVTQARRNQSTNDRNDDNDDNEDNASIEGNDETLSMPQIGGKGAKYIAVNKQETCMSQFVVLC